VFADWPYLYEGDADYEARYLSRFAASPGAVMVAARDGGGRMVGAATAAPLADHADEFAAPFARAGLDPADFFYLAESVLLARVPRAGRRTDFLRDARGCGPGAGVRARGVRLGDPAFRPSRRGRRTMCP
jgi:hypothetical protein